MVYTGVGISDYLIFLIFFGRPFWVFRAKIFLAAGIMGMPASKFLLADLAAALLTVPLTVMVGYRGDRALRQMTMPELSPEPIVIVAAAVTAIVVAALAIQRFTSLQKQTCRPLSRELPAENGSE